MRLKTAIARTLPERVKSALRLVAYPERYAFFGPPLTYSKDGLATVHNADFARDPAFARAYRASKSAGVWVGPWGEADPEWRVFVACWAAERAVQLGGDFVECGVFRGGLAWTVMEFIGFRSMTDRVFWLLDTFAGIPPEQVDPDDAHRHQYWDTFDEVARRFADYRHVKIVPGPIPSTLRAVTSDRVGFLSIDMNAAYPEVHAAEFFWDRMVPGGAILFDDYGWFGHEAQKQAVDEFVQRHGRRVLPLPTGQGLVLK